MTTQKKPICVAPLDWMKQNKAWQYQIPTSKKPLCQQTNKQTKVDTNTNKNTNRNGIETKVTD